MSALCREIGCRGRADAVVADDAPEPSSQLAEPEDVAAPDAMSSKPRDSGSGDATGVQAWSVADVHSWLRDVMQIPDVADATSAEEIDGATAQQLDKGDWKELGCAGLKAAKVMGALAKLEAGH